MQATVELPDRDQLQSSEMQDALVDQVQRNKAIVTRLFEEMAYPPRPNIDVLHEIVADDYIQHNPFAGQGREGVKRFFERLVPLPPWLDASGTTTVNLIAQDDLMVRQEMRTRGMLVDVFRVRNGLCVEHWDAYRPDPGTDRIPGSEVAREPAMTTTRTARSAR